MKIDIFVIYKYLIQVKMNQQEQKPFGKLFNTIDIQSEEHLDMILQTMTKENALFIMVQALKFAYQSGIYTLGETEVLSKSIRTMSKQEEQKETSEN